MRMQVSPKALFTSAREKLEAAGLHPLLPQNCGGCGENPLCRIPTVNFDFEVPAAGSTPLHCCHREVDPPEMLFLVTPLVGILEATSGGAWYTFEFSPYWAVGKVIHFAHQMTSDYRDSATVKALCAMGQHDYIKSFLSKGVDWPLIGGRVEACYTTDHKAVLRDNPQLGENHHRFVIRRTGQFDRRRVEIKQGSKSQATRL